MLELLVRHVGAHRDRLQVGQGGHAEAALLTPVDPPDPGLLLSGDFGLFWRGGWRGRGEGGGDLQRLIPTAGGRGWERGGTRGGGARLQKTGVRDPPSPFPPLSSHSTHTTSPPSAPPHPPHLPPLPPPHLAHHVLILQLRQVGRRERLFCEDRARGGPGGPEGRVAGVPGRVGRALGQEDEHVFLMGGKAVGGGG